MTRCLKWSLFLICFLISGISYAKTEPVRATEGDISTPYDTIGTIEVKKKVRAYLPGSSGDRYRKSLKKMLVKKASRHYGANAVINVHYWPDPDAQSFPQGFVYARGEMVRYQAFPEKS